MSRAFKGTNDEVLADVPHQQQKFSWDCGIASVKMVLLFCQKEFEHDFEEVCRKLKFGTSVWTIDIAYILHHYGLEFVYTTTTLGVDKGYSNQSFYKEKFSSDEERVNTLFSQAENQEIIVQKRSCSLKEITDHIQRGNVIIALIDWNHLKCDWCDLKCLPTFSCVGRCLGTYQGHYIVVCGYNEREQVVYYKNPSYSKDLCKCSFNAFNAARMSYGTDEDIIFVDCGNHRDVDIQLHGAIEVTFTGS